MLLHEDGDEMVIIMWWVEGEVSRREDHGPMMQSLPYKLTVGLAVEEIGRASCRERV